MGEGGYFRHVDIVLVVPSSRGGLIVSNMTTQDAPATRTAIASHQAEHQALLTQLGNLDYTIAARVTASERVETLRKDIAAKELELQKVKDRTRKEYDDFHRITNSVISRAAVKIRGRGALDARVVKEEQEWLQALREVGVNANT